MTATGDADGVFPNQHLSAAIRDGFIHGRGVSEAQVQPASIDLRLGPVAHRLRCSFLPAEQTVKQRLKSVVLDEFSIAGDGAILWPGTPYLVQLKERLALPPDVRAKANPKSSTGRADVFTRVISDHGHRFDDVAASYEGGIWVEIVPLSFPVRVNENLSLNQLRLSRGRTQLDDRALADLHRSATLLRAGNEAVPSDALRLADGLLLGLDLRGDSTGRVGHRARSSPPLLDLTKVREANPAEYWDPVLTVARGRIILTPRVFYLLMSYEAVTIPPGYAAEMTAYDPTSGELRSHYAGFFDPGFGYDPAGGDFGSTAALEVRAHDVPFLIDHRQPVCKLTFERMVEEPTLLYGGTIGSNYQGQSETLGKHFRAHDFVTRRRSTPPAGQLDLLGDNV